MTNTIIISLCVLLLIAYIFDLSTSKTKIPSVILLLISGWLLRKLVAGTGIILPDLSGVLPMLGTLGLILIVLEGSMELQLSRNKLPFVFKAFGVACISILLLSAALVWFLHSTYAYNLRDCLINVLPLTVISSAIAIPTARNLNPEIREFIIYESSLSDIVGVLLFNFILSNTEINFESVVIFSLNTLLMLVISVISTLLLGFLLGKISHHVKFIPIMVLVILIYSLSKEIHLPSLVFILLFGITLRNLGKLERFNLPKSIDLSTLKRESRRFEEITAELAFLIRALFFLLFGYMLEEKEVISPDEILVALAISAGIYISRYLLLVSLRLKPLPGLFIAPRGLITILLFLSIPVENVIPEINRSLVIQVVLISSFMMMPGMFAEKSGSPIH